MKQLISPNEALAEVLAAAVARSAVRMPIEASIGLVLGEDVRADRPYPPFDRAMMDGYAVRVADAGGRVRVAGEVKAGESADFRVSDGFAASIMTGAPCPEGAEAVVPKEDVRITEGYVELPVEVKTGINIAPRGSECAAGAAATAAGEVVTPLVLANLAAFGYENVMAVPRPCCAAITTGSELVAPGIALGPAQIRDSNGPMLAAMFRQAGVEDFARFHAVDTVSALAGALDAAERANIVTLAGGVSMGKYDLVPEALARHGVEILFHKVMQKPGKPLLFGRKGNRLFFGLPGNPLAVYFCFHRYVLLALRRTMGMAPEPRWTFEGRLTSAVRGAGPRTAFLLCRAERAAEGWRVTPLKGKGTADIHSVCSANAYIRVDPGQESVAADSMIAFEWVRYGWTVSG